MSHRSTFKVPLPEDIPRRPDTDPGSQSVYRVVCCEAVLEVLPAQHSSVTQGYGHPCGFIILGFQHLFHFPLACAMGKWKGQIGITVVW